MNERPDMYYIPDNLNSRKKFLGIPNRNLIELALVEFVLIMVIRMIPFSIPMIVIAIIVLVGVGIFLAVGIHHESVTEFIITFMKFKARKAKYHLRKVSDDEEIVEEEQRENERVIGENIFGKFFGKEEGQEAKQE